MKLNFSICLRLTVALVFWGYAELLTAQDSIASRALDEVVVEAALQKTSTQISTFIPTSKQKQASQSGFDLVNRMAIPKLRITPGSDAITSASGQSVALFVDGVPVTADQIRTMRPGDVKRVEYLEYPADPRFQGNERVINFVMQQYEYGGYVKLNPRGMAIDDFASMQANVKMQYRRMTYDLMGYGRYLGSDHHGTEGEEIFRLPQGNSIETFKRTTDLLGSKYRHNDWQGSFRALYNSGNITASSLVNGAFGQVISG